MPVARGRKGKVRIHESTPPVCGCRCRMTPMPRSAGSWVPRSGQPTNAVKHTSAAALSESLRALQVEVEALRDLYENAPNAYLLLDTGGRILRVNRRATELLGYSAVELAGAPIHSFMADTPAGK